MSARRRPRTQTDHQRAVAACDAHLRDLKRICRRPAPDVAIPSVAIPLRLSGPPPASYCVSPGQLCAELAE
ncbi:MAG: hypothetical protein E7774_03470 [Bradyrhizobium sp.]|nr:MAG: hypothetical protein E7774_03470 [Bradyrhizobium sp.]